MQQLNIATIQKLKEELKKELKTELVNEFITLILEQAKDPEGEYRLEFIKDILRAVDESTIGEYKASELNKLIS